MLPSPPAISQRSSTSDSLACTSTTASIGDPGSCRVGRLGEWPSAPMNASQSCERRCLFGSCSSSWSACLISSSSSSPCLGSASVIGGLGSSSSCSSSSSSDMEESAGQLTSWRSPNLAIRATSWETCSWLRPQWTSPQPMLDLWQGHAQGPTLLHPW